MCLRKSSPSKNQPDEGDAWLREHRDDNGLYPYEAWDEFGAVYQGVRGNINVLQIRTYNYADAIGKRTIAN